MRFTLMAILLMLISLPIGAETMDCSYVSPCAYPSPNEYITSIATANDAGTEVWISFFDSTYQLLRFDPVNCTSLGWIDLPGIYGVSGLAWDGDALWCVSKNEGMIYKLDPSTWTVLASFPTPSGRSGSNDIAWDGQHLWHVNSGEMLIYKLDPETGEVLDSLPAPGSFPWGVEIVDGVLYLADHSGGTIYAIDSTTGDILGSCTPYGSEFSLSTQGVAARPDGSFWLLTRMYGEIYDLEIDWSVGIQESTWSTIKSHY